MSQSKYQSIRRDDQRQRVNESKKKKGEKGKDKEKYDLKVRKRESLGNRSTADSPARSSNGVCVKCLIINVNKRKTKDEEKKNDKKKRKK